jgi:natural product precursor
MKKITEIKAEMLSKQLLTQSQMLQVKGGEELTDDKRRPRPGGGSSTQ